MDWVIIANIAFATIITVLILLKIHLRRRLNNIDGLCGIHTENLNSNAGTVIGNFGDNEPRDKGQ